MIGHSDQQLSDELNFTAFIDLCRFCAIRNGPRLNIFEKEAEDRQILFKIRTLLPVTVSHSKTPIYKNNQTCFYIF